MLWNKLTLGCMFCPCRDVGDGGRHLVGALEAAVVGKRHPVLPCLHEQRRAALPGHSSQPPGAFRDRGGADAHPSYLRHGEWEGVGTVMVKDGLESLMCLVFVPCVCPLVPPERERCV